MNIQSCCPLIVFKSWTHLIGILNNVAVLKFCLWHRLQVLLHFGLTSCTFCLCCRNLCCFLASFWSSGWSPSAPRLCSRSRHRSKLCLSGYLGSSEIRNQALNIQLPSYDCRPSGFAFKRHCDHNISRTYYIKGTLEVVNVSTVVNYNHNNIVFTVVHEYHTTWWKNWGWIGILKW